MLSRTSWHTSDTEEAAGAFSQTFGNTKIDIQEKSPALDVHFDVLDSLGTAPLVLSDVAAADSGGGPLPDVVAWDGSVWGSGA